MVLAAGIAFSDLTHTFPAVLRPIAFDLLGALLAALALAPARKLRWYWRMLAAPLLSAVALFALISGYEYIINTMYDPEV